MRGARKAEVTRRGVLAGGLALAGGTALPLGAWANASEAAGPARPVLAVEARGVFGAERAFEAARARLEAEGMGQDASRWLLVSEAGRTARFDGALVSPGALLALPTPRLAALLGKGARARIDLAVPAGRIEAVRLVERTADLMAAAPAIEAAVVVLRAERRAMRDAMSHPGLRVITL